MTPEPGRVGRRRVYVRLPLTALLPLARGGAQAAPAGRGYAVTSLVRAAFPGQDEEELEYEAMCVAADAPLSDEAPTDAGATGAGTSRMVVVAADLPAADVRDVSTPSTDAPDRPIDAVQAYAVTLAQPLHRADLVALHVQERPEDPDAELLWYDATELAALAAQLS